ncbi:phosphotransferase [Phytomonospora sp. NPDC050363]|uniref:phosphotransferase n=1 Tax=Phytomonospora sp. NPDC050363 TaxID=3155642 RepID=UPI0033C458EB
MELIGKGRDADVYALDDARVLRRYRAGGSTDDEARLMEYLAGHGFPVPTVHDSDGADIVLDRLRGPTMTKAATSRPWLVARHGRVLADLHNRLHRIPAPGWLRGHGESGDRVLHLDLHPDNVMLTPDGPVVIDWRTARAGDPGVDVAAVLVLFKVMRPPVPWYLQGPIALAKAPLLAAFLTKVEDEPRDEHIHTVLGQKLHDPNLSPAERARLRDWWERMA